ncbi:MAG: hypothetical protein OJF47_003769 [Nitrospira sp.]|jgi:hypothetical protein|nr:MAG: hypothetical protein OJF47_003769 [Nitrospira sp.]
MGGSVLLSSPLLSFFHSLLHRGHTGYFPWVSVALPPAEHYSGMACNLVRPGRDLKERRTVSCGREGG